jgi:hypothetical protein
LQPEHHSHAQQHSAMMQRFIRRLGDKFVGSGKSRSGKASSEKARVQRFFHGISQRIKELERRKSGTANEATIQGLGNQRL